MQRLYRGLNMPKGFLVSHRFLKQSAMQNTHRTAHPSRTDSIETLIPDNRRMRHSEYTRFGLIHPPEVKNQQACLFPLFAACAAFEEPNIFRIEPDILCGWIQYEYVSMPDPTPFE